MGMLLFGTVLTSLGAILPSLIEKFDLTNLQAGSLASILPAGILVGSLFFGPVVDRYSYRNLLVICALMITLGLEGLAFSNNLLYLQGSFFLIGMGGGAMNGGTNALVADISEANPDQRSANLSLLGIFFGIGALGVPALMAFLSKVWSYETILFYTGLATLIPSIYCLITRFPAPKQNQVVSLRTILAMFGDSALLILGLFLFFQSAMEGLINNWVTTFLQSEHNVDAQLALLALSIFVLSLTITRLVLAVLLRKRTPYRILVISLFGLLAGAILLNLPQIPFSYFIGMILAGMGAAAIFPVILGYVSELYTDLTGTAFSFVFVLALVGNILINYLMGLIAQVYGLNLYPWILAGCILGMLIISLTRLPSIIKK